MKITGLRLFLQTPDGDVEVDIMEKIPTMDLKPGEMAHLVLPIVMNDEGSPFVPMQRYN